MLRRRPARFRQGEASFGRRVPRCNFALIRAEVEAINRISVIDFDRKNEVDPSKVESADFKVPGSPKDSPKDRWPFRHH